MLACSHPDTTLAISAAGHTHCVQVAHKHCFGNSSCVLRPSCPPPRDSLALPTPLQILACITFQFAAGGLSLAPDSSSATLERAAAEMDRMLDAFLRWQAAVR